MKRTTAREFARNQATIVARLKPGETLAVTKHGKIVFSVTKPGTAKRRYFPAGKLLKDLAQLPMTEAEGDEVLRKFVGAGVF